VLAKNASRLARLDGLVPESEDLPVGHRGEFLTPDLEVGCRYLGIGVGDDGGVTGAGDLDLVGRGSVGGVRASRPGECPPRGRWVTLTPICSSI